MLLELQLKWTLWFMDLENSIGPGLFGSGSKSVEESTGQGRRRAAASLVPKVSWKSLPFVESPSSVAEEGVGSMNEQTLKAKQ